MPKLWSETIESHRVEVREALMETAWALALEHGPMSVTMSQVAQEAGIGRATLYKYFPDVASILHARHERHVAGHLARLVEVRDATTDPARRLEVVAAAYGEVCFHRAQHGTVELSALTHAPERVAGAEKQLLELFEELLGDAARGGAVRADVSAGELALYCVHALGAAGRLPSRAAVRRLVSVTLAALEPVTD